MNAKAENNATTAPSSLNVAENTAPARATEPTAKDLLDHAIQSAVDSRMATTLSFVPKSFEDLIRYCEYLSKSNFVPKSYRGQPADILVAVQMGGELGMPPLQSLQSFGVINGRPGLFGDGFLAVIMGHWSYEWHEEHWEGSGDARKAVCTMKRKGHQAHTVEFSVSDAKAAGLWDERKEIRSQSGGSMSNPSPWHCYSDRMLQMRARGFAGRDKFADALRGMKTVEELGDYPDARGVAEESQLSTSEAESLPLKQEDCRIGTTQERETLVEIRLRGIAASLMKERGVEDEEINEYLDKYKGRTQKLIDKIRATGDEQPAPQEKPTPNAHGVALTNDDIGLVDEPDWIRQQPPTGAVVVPSQKFPARESANGRRVTSKEWY